MSCKTLRLKPYLWGWVVDIPGLVNEPNQGDPLALLCSHFPMNLRSKVIRLAHQRPELRPHLLPLLKEAGLWGGADNTRREALSALEAALDTSSGIIPEVSDSFLEVYDRVMELALDFPIPHVALESAIEKVRKEKEALVASTQDYTQAIKNLIPLLKSR